MIDLANYGWKNAMLPDNAQGIPARITAEHKGRFEIVSEKGEGFARLKTANYFYGSELVPAVGDFVLLDWNPQGDSQILRTLPRKSVFSRLDPSSSGHAEQVAASNFDYVFLISSMNQDLNLRRMERYLTLAWQSGAVPVIVLTKSDLMAPDQTADCIGQISGIAAGVDIIPVSAYTGQGLSRLSGFLAPGQTVVLLGSSGVGKSSLVNALAGEERMKVQGIRQDDDKGRHTTTYRQLMLLPGGGLIIDTPGMRELGMWDVSQGLGQSFFYVEQFFSRCRFRDCSHTSEPGCGIRQAIQDGELSEERWQSYLKLKKEAKILDKSSFLKEKQQRNKAIAQKSRNLKKYGKNGHF